MSKVSLVFDIHDDPIMETELDQNIEISAAELSGDEALESSFGSNSIMSKSKFKSSVGLASFTVTKSILGVGILGLPYVMYNFGLVLTIVIIIIMYFVIQYNTRLLLKCKNMSRHSNFSSIGYSIFRSRWILITINLMLILNNFGLTFAEMIIQGTAIKGIVSDQNWYSSPLFVQIISAAVMLPMMVVKKIEKLKFVSVFAVISMIVFVVTLMISFIEHMQKEGFAIGFGMWPYDFSFIKAFGAFPTLLLAYNWQFNLFPIFKSLKKGTDKNTMIAANTGMLIATIFYLLVAFFGYAIYGETLSTNLLQVMTKETVTTVGYYILNSAFYISTILTTPLVFFTARNNLFQMLNIKSHFELISMLVFIIIVIGAITIASLEVAFNLIGAISSNAIGCIFPTLFYYKLLERKPITNKLEYYFAKGFFYFSLLLSILCIGSELIKIIQ